MVGYFKDDGHPVQHAACGKGPKDVTTSEGNISHIPRNGGFGHQTGRSKKKDKEIVKGKARPTRYA